MDSALRPWSADSLADFVRARLADVPLVVVSNREPYIHEAHPDGLRWIRPASGLVTGLDPVLRAAGGTWIAHGAGSGDRAAVDAQDRVAVPPDQPRYTLRRVWLTEDLERGYYYGFANETLWPLCHITYVRPQFRRRDWQAYRDANEIFAAAITEEAPPEAAVWLHDYHLALLPALLRARRPDLTLAHFWHIPWPTPEVFRICPWKRELLEGLLANDLLGFHIRYHCDNFLAAVARELEARVDRERSSVTYRGHTTLVRPLPISVASEEIAAEAASGAVVREMAQLSERCRLDGARLVMGLDRFDYTKGIPERLLAVDRLLTRYPEWRGRVRFVQAGVPSRTRIPAYQALGREIEGLVSRVNRQHGNGGPAPVLFLEEHLSWTSILALYRLADCLMVTSLHDGMNLVAKEYVAARVDGDGTLLLSEFTGAARELHDALLVNPYDVDATAAHLAAGLGMPEVERRRRMARLREQVRQSNIYRWAAETLEVLARLAATRAAA